MESLKLFINHLNYVNYSLSSKYSDSWCHIDFTKKSFYELLSVDFHTTDHVLSTFFPHKDQYYILT